MAVRDKEFLMSIIKKYTGETEPTDETLKEIEDFTDTVNDMENKSNTDWKAKYEENDRTWREKYKERFFNSEAETQSQQTETQVETQTKKLEYSDLFKKEG